VQGTTLASPADWKAQTNVEGEKEWSEFDEESHGILFSQLKIVLRGYGSGKPIGIRSLRINNSKHQKKESAKAKSASIPLPSLALEEESDEDTDALPSMKTASSTILQDRLAELKDKLNKEETSEPPAEPVVPAAPTVSFVIHVANEAEFDPNYDANKMKVSEEPSPKKVASRLPKPAVEVPTTKPLAHVVLSVSGIGPERSDIRNMVAELGGTYSHDLPSTALPGQQLLLLVDAASDQWHNTPKHQQAIAQDVPIVDKSWISACKKRNQCLAVGPYLPKFRTGEGKVTPPPGAIGGSTAKSTISVTSSSLPSSSAPVSKPAKKGTIKAEGGSYSTEKPAKGDEVESDGPDEYVFDDFVVPDEADIEYFDDADYDLIDEPFGGPGHHHSKPKPPKINLKSIPARMVFSQAEIDSKLQSWMQKCSNILGRKVGGQTAIAPPKKETVVTAFGMDIDDNPDVDAASDGTNPIDAAELAELNRDL